LHSFILTDQVLDHILALFQFGSCGSATCIMSEKCTRLVQLPDPLHDLAKHCADCTCIGQAQDRKLGVQRALLQSPIFQRRHGGIKEAWRDKGDMKEKEDMEGQRRHEG
jgi:hypothetical protein